MRTKRHADDAPRPVGQFHLIPVGSLKRHRPAPEIEGLVGDSEQMRALRAAVALVAACHSTVIITGESGTGKELVARAVHDLGARRDKPFRAVNCGAFAEGLLEAELFGHTKGAFTGAISDRQGVFAAADGGTVFLDEVGEMTPAMQVRLLRVLQERKVMPVGAREERGIDVRVITATNRDLQAMVTAGTFREDLHYRLAVVPVHTPPLRSRKSDIEALAHHLLRVVYRRAGRSRPAEITTEALEALRGHHWPGNVRELENTLERLTAVAEEGAAITASDVRSAVLTGGSAYDYGGTFHGRGETMSEHFSRQELNLYYRVLESVGGNHARAARVLGVERTALHKRVRRLEERLAMSRAEVRAITEAKGRRAHGSRRVGGDDA